MRVDYEAYASMSPLRKNHVWPQLTAENKAELAITHWSRFLEANRARLNAAQIRALEQVIERHPEQVYSEQELRDIFAFEDFIWLHLGAFKNSGEIHNPIARILARKRPRTEDLEDLRGALYDVATLAPDDLRLRRPDIPALLGRYYDGMPADFWSLVSDEDVPLAAAEGRALIGMLLKKAGAPPPPAPPC